MILFNFILNSYNMNTLEFNLVVSRTRPRLVAYLTDHIKDEELANDLVQDIFLKAIETVNEGKHIANMESYLFIMTRNRLIDYWRKAAVDRQLREAYWEKIQAHNLSEPVGGTEMDLDFFQNSISRSLTSQQRIIYEMYSQQGLSVEEIAIELGITKSTAKQHLILVRKKAREYIDRYGLYILGFISFRM